MKTNKKSQSIQSHGGTGLKVQTLVSSKIFVCPVLSPKKHKKTQNHSFHARNQCKTCISTGFDICSSQGVDKMRCAWKQRLIAHLERLRMKGRGDKYIRRVHTEIVKMFKSLEKEGLRVHPKHIGEREVNHWIGMFPPGRFGTQRNAQYHLDIMQVFLKAIGNNIIPEMDIRLDTTVRLAWMPSYDEAEHVWATAQRIGGLERFGVYCAQFLGLRRTALIRMKTEWYRDGTLYVTSKGSRKGKTRKISPPHDFDYEWNLAMRARDEIISHAVVDWDWRGPIPDHVFLNYSCRNGLSHHRESAMDRMIKAIGKEAHYPKISWHPLRRRFGRNMYDAGVDLEIIRDILGHSDLDTTRKYIMLDLEDQKGAFQALAKYRRTKEEVLTERIRADSTVYWG